MISQTIGRPIEIVLVKDNPGDVRLAVEAFKGGQADEPSKRGRGRSRGYKS